jgi:hypothetical protein
VPGSDGDADEQGWLPPYRSPLLKQKLRNRPRTRFESLLNGFTFQKPAATISGPTTGHPPSDLLAEHRNIAFACIVSRTRLITLGASGFMGGFFIGFSAALSVASID